MEILKNISPTGPKEYVETIDGVAVNVKIDPVPQDSDNKYFELLAASDLNHQGKTGKKFASLAEEIRGCYFIGALDHLAKINPCLVAKHVAKSTTRALMLVTASKADHACHEWVIILKSRCYRVYDLNTPGGEITKHESVDEAIINAIRARVLPGSVTH